MASVSTLIVLAAFLLGAVAGGLLVAISRRAGIDRIREEFRAELESYLDREISARLGSEKANSGATKAASAPFDPKPPGGHTNRAA